MKVEPKVALFQDNWSYLKAELAWLDRVLMRAMAKHRQSDREVSRVARSAADKATSHWWQGFINLDPAKGGSQVSNDLNMQTNAQVYGHPLGRYGDRIAASIEHGIVLNAPTLCQQLGLGKFERDLIILCLAPEISRRYEKLYAFLNGDDDNCRQPTVDLALRLFCRSDLEWRASRNTLQPKAPLLKNKILEIHESNTTARSLLSKSLQLSGKFVTYLLSDDIPLSAVLPKPRKRRSP
ncbi:hypothetical protein [Pseudanabaena sp. PCC 6802]|uniref:hypothetical protein n=1 Tax=Pseudanabaena sp. PCC 6802 TaxID=118173 RepID=UPI00034507DC|nr:hypothetical protein [Pseudanabaena sp. PCC 6802]